MNLKIIITRKKRIIVSGRRLKNRGTFRSHRQNNISLDSSPISDKAVLKLKKKELIEQKLTIAQIRFLNAKTFLVRLTTILVILKIIKQVTTFIITAVLPQFFDKRYHQLCEVFEYKGLAYDFYLSKF